MGVIPASTMLKTEFGVIIPDGDTQGNVSVSGRVCENRRGSNYKSKKFSLSTPLKVSDVPNIFEIVAIFKPQTHTLVYVHVPV